MAIDSKVETFAALEVLIHNERWAGVPFQLRTGKALAASRDTLTLGFKQPVQQMLRRSDAASAVARPNEISFELSEPGVIWIDFLAKQPGASMDLGSASLTFRYGDSFDVANELEGYERLLHDTMLGDHTLFTSAGGIERLWEVSTPLLEQPPNASKLRRGSWGPEAIDQLVAPHRWHLPYGERRSRWQRDDIIVHPDDNRRHGASSSVRNGGPANARAEREAKCLAKTPPREESSAVGPKRTRPRELSLAVGPKRTRPSEPSSAVGPKRTRPREPSSAVGPKRIRPRRGSHGPLGNTGELNGAALGGAALHE